MQVLHTAYLLRCAVAEESQEGKAEMKITTQKQFDAAMIELKANVAAAQVAKTYGQVENMVDAISDANYVSGCMAEYLKGKRK